MIIRGKVFSGKGEGEFYINLYARNIRRKLGFNPYPGTLNIRIEDKYVNLYKKRIKELEPIIVEPPAIPGARLGAALFYPAHLYNTNVYIVRPEITIYGYDVAEVVAPFSIRARFKLRDGDVVEIDV